MGCRWILTAAQCVSPLVADSLKVDNLIAKVGGFDAGSPSGKLGDVSPNITNIPALSGADANVHQVLTHEGQSEGSCPMLKNFHYL